MARNLGYGHHVEPPEVLSYAIGLFSRLEVVVAVQRRVEAGAWTPDQVFHSGSSQNSHSDMETDDHSRCHTSHLHHGSRGTD